MKRFFFIQLAILTAAGLVQARDSKANGFDKLPGVYESGGFRFVITRSGQTFTVRTQAEMTREKDCRTRIGRSVRAESSERYAEAYFMLDKGDCPGIDGRVTLHYNKTIFGTDVFLFDVVLRRNTMSIGSRQRDNSHVIRWSLHKLQGK